MAVVGDVVNFDINEDGTGVIFEIAERKNYIARKAIKTRGASYRGERLQQIIAANIDNIFIVSSIFKPDFNNKTVDRFLVASESSHINVYLIINKSDLTDIDSLNEWADLYKDIGYEVFITSVIAQTGISRVKDKLAGKKNLFWGQSGVGKSSLLNSLYTDLKFKIGEISDYTSKGVHTTVTSTMIYVGDKTYIIDTPGVREIDPYGIRKEDLGHYFIDFEKFINKCKFNTCTHHHEPSCAVIKALKNGDIYTERYDSYLRILETVEEDINF